MEFNELFYGSGFWLGWLILVIGYLIIVKWNKEIKIPLSVVYFFIAFDQYSNILNVESSSYVWGILGMLAIVIYSILRGE